MVSRRSLRKRTALLCLNPQLALAAIAVLVCLTLSERGANQKLRRALKDERRENLRVGHLLHHLPVPCTERGQIMLQLSPLIVSNLRPDAAPAVAGAVRQMPPVHVAPCTATMHGETKRELPPDAVGLATVARPSVYGINLTSDSPGRLLLRGAGPKHQVGPILSTVTLASA